MTRHSQPSSMTGDEFYDTTSDVFSTATLTPSSLWTIAMSPHASIFTEKILYPLPCFIHLYVSMAKTMTMVVPADWSQPAKDTNG